MLRKTEDEQKKAKEALQMNFKENNTSKEEEKPSEQLMEPSH